MSPKYDLKEPKLIEKANGETYGLCRIPGLVLTEKGTLLGYYECRADYSDWSKIDIKVIRSTDKGDTFNTTLLIEGNGDTLNNPVMTVQDGTVHLLFMRNYSRLYYSKSTDDGVSFSKPRDITYVLEQGERYTVAATGPGHGIVHNGNIIVPLWFGYNPNDPKAHHPSSLRTLFSCDKGETWCLGEIIGEDKLTDANESALAITPDGRVLISIRHCTEGVGKRALSVSPNGYSDWSTVRFCDNLPDPGCMGSMFSYGGKVYHVNCASTSGRKDLTLKESEDCFDTCESVLVSSLGGYSDVAVGDSDIFVFFERDLLHKKDVFNNDGLYFLRIEK